MMRSVLAIPLEEVRRHFAVHERQSLKIVAPQRLGAALLARLREAGVDPKPETSLAGDTWRHTAPGEPNAVCESGEFGELGPGGFAISFGTEHAPQERHVHRRHAEIYFSEHVLSAEYEVEADGRCGELKLPEGGVLVFAPGVIHEVRFGGLTIVIEVPAVAGDKYVSGGG